MTPPELCTLVYKTFADESVNALCHIMNPVYDWLQDGDVASLTEFYTTLDVERMNLLHLAGLVRQTCSYGHKIPGWDAYRLRAIDEARVRYPAQSVLDAFYNLLDDPWIVDEPNSLSTSFDQLVGIHPTLVRD